MKFARTAIVLAAALGAGSAMAQDIQFSGGLKAWNHSFDLNAGNTRGSATDKSNFNTTSTLLSVTARKGEYFLTYSMLLPSTYALNSGDIKRQDSDIALGWSFMPGYSVLVGQKNIKTKGYDLDRQSWSASASSTDKGTFIALTGAQSLQDRIFAYESIAYLPKMKNDTEPNSSIKFTTLEVGLGYTLDTKTQLTVGLRNQSYDLADPSRSNYRQKVKLNGLIFGASYNF